MPNPIVGVVSHGLPPGMTGYQIILEELLGDIPAEKIVLVGVGRQPWGLRRRLSLPILRVPANPWESLGDGVLMASATALARLPRLLPRVHRVFATLDPTIGFAASWARAVGAELWVYAIDLHAAGFWTAPRGRRLVGRWRTQALQQASRCFGLSEVMADWLRAAGSRVPAEVLPPLIRVEPEPPTRAEKRSFLFMGWLYSANARPLKWLEEAAAEHPDVELRLVSHSTEADLRRLGLDPARWKRTSVAPHQVREEVARARWTVAALDPNPADRASLQVAWPTKLRDYLGTGRPVICIAGPDFALARFASGQLWGTVVGDAQGVQAAMAQALAENQEEYEARCAAAVAFARQRMNNETIGAAFRQALLA